MFGKLSRNLGGARDPWFEIIERGSMPDLKSQDVRCYLNHERNLVLARSKYGNGSLKLSVDSVGLKYEFDAPKSTVGEDLLEAIRRGDIDQSSFAFVVAPGGDRWEERDGKRIRRISKIAKLLDVSPVAEPAYEDTTVGARGAQTRQNHFSPQDEILLAKLGILPK
jgi:HK97 family phage prohead protease